MHSYSIAWWLSGKGPDNSPGFDSSIFHSESCSSAGFTRNRQYSKKKPPSKDQKITNIQHIYVTFHDFNCVFTAADVHNDPCRYTCEFNITQYGEEEDQLSPTTTTRIQDRRNHKDTIKAGRQSHSCPTAKKNKLNLHWQPQKKDLYRKEGKGRRCCLGDRIYSILCHASYFGPG